MRQTTSTWPFSCLDQHVQSCDAQLFPPDWSSSFIKPTGFIYELERTACLAAAAALGYAAAVDRLAAATTQAHVFCVHLLLCFLHYTRISCVRREAMGREGLDGTHRLLSNNSGVGGRLHGLLLLWDVEIGHFVRKLRVLYRLRVAISRASGRLQNQQAGRSLGMIARTLMMAGRRKTE